MKQNHARSQSLPTKLVLFAAVSLTLSACGKNNGVIPESRKVHRAPQSQREVGVIVSGLSVEDMADLLDKEPQLTVRVVNQEHNLYEVHGMKSEHLRELIADAKVTVEDNKFIKLKPEIQKSGDEKVKVNFSSPSNQLLVAIENNMNLKLTGAPREFVATCKLSNTKGPDVKVEHNQTLDRTKGHVSFELGKPITVSSEKSTSQLTDKKTSHLWIINSPDDSNLGPTFVLSSKTDFMPDTTGVYISAAVVKDADGYCDLGVLPFFVTANDPFLPINVLPDNNSQMISNQTFWHIFHVGSQNTWPTSTGEGELIAILDTGVNYNHPALAANIRVNPNEIPNNNIDDDKNGFVDDTVGYDFVNDDAFPFDDSGHGSHVAGIAASNVFGAARKAKLLPVKIGSDVGFDLASVTGGIRYAVDNGARILNLSFGGGGDIQVIHDAINYAESKNVLVVAAAGNNGTNNDDVGHFPSNYENKNLIAVGASDENDVLTSYSNYGQHVHIAAPGGTQRLPIMSSFKKNPQNTQLIGFSGTSMASPLVAGIAAQVWSINKKLSATQVRELIISTGRSVEALKGKTFSGKVVDTAKALERAKIDASAPVLAGLVSSTSP